MPPLTPLLRPGAYFRRADRPSLAVAALIVTLDALLSVLAVWLFLDAVVAKTAPSPEAAAEVRGAVGGALFGVLVAVPIGWLLVAALVHFFVWMADGARGYGHTLAVIGESSVVSIAVFPVTVVGFYLLLGRVPAETEAAAEFFRRAAEGGTPLLLLTGLVKGIWEALVQAVGLSEVQGIVVEKAAVVTLGLAVLGFLGQLV